MSNSPGFVIVALVAAIVVLEMLQVFATASGIVDNSPGAVVTQLITPLSALIGFFAGKAHDAAQEK